MDRRLELARLRARYLAAMGVPLVAVPAVFFIGCERPGGLVSAPTSHGEAASVASSSFDASALDDTDAAVAKVSHDPPEPVPPSFAHTATQECSIEIAPPQPPELPPPFEGCPRRWNEGQFTAKATRLERANSGEACCYVRFHGRPMLGRALRGADDHAVADAGLRSRSDWLAQVSATLAQNWDDEARARATAARFRDDARAEHASVAAFAQLALDLMEVGAPADLVADAHRAALDEIEHAKIAFAIAARIDGRALGPDALPVPRRTRAITVRELVREAIVDGAFGEGVAAMVARMASETAEDPALRALLARVAEDEERHAALAYRTFAWALAAFGGVAREAAAEALASIAVGCDALDGAGEDDVRARVLSAIVEPCIASAIAAATAGASAAASSARA